MWNLQPSCLRFPACWDDRLASPCPAPSSIFNIHQSRILSEWLASFHWSSVYRGLGISWQKRRHSTQQIFIRDLLQTDLSSQAQVSNRRVLRRDFSEETFYHSPTAWRHSEGGVERLGRRWWRWWALSQLQQDGTLTILISPTMHPNSAMWFPVIQRQPLFHDLPTGLHGAGDGKK